MTKTLTEKVGKTSGKEVNKGSRRDFMRCVAYGSLAGIVAASGFGYLVYKDSREPSLMKRVEARENELGSTAGYDGKNTYIHGPEGDVIFKGEGSGHYNSWLKKREDWSEEKNQMVMKSIYSNPEEARKYIFSEISDKDKKKLKNLDFSSLSEKEIQELNRAYAKYDIDLPTDPKKLSESDKLVIQYAIRELMLWEW